MRSLYLLVLVSGFLWEECVHGRVINSNADEVHSTFGHLYLLNSNTGHSQRLKRRHVEAPEEAVQRLRLDLGTGDQLIDMDLKGGSVWDSNSDARVRNGEHTKQIVSDVQTNCFFSGRLKTGNGYASFSFCNGVDGIINTMDANYVIGAIDPDATSSNDTDSDLPSLSVRITRTNEMKPILDDDIEDEEIAELDKDDEEIPDENQDLAKPDNVHNSGTTENIISSRTTTPTSIEDKITIEVGIYINADYTNALYKQGLNSASKIMSWVINRWNIIRDVFSDTEQIGAKVDIKLKVLEIWSVDPEYFAMERENRNINNHLGSFCKRAPEDKRVDHKMMYTWETSQSIVGLSYVGGVCRPKSKCSIVIPSKNGVQRELHEFGHNLGLAHDNKVKACKWPYGFMGWQNNNEFKDCYRSFFVESIRKPSRRCLYSETGLQSQVFEYKNLTMIDANQTLSDVLQTW